MYVDHLEEHMKRLARRRIEDHRDSLPRELSNLPDARIIDLITDMATPILRKIEDDAIDAAIAKASSMIRYAKTVEIKKVK